MKIFQFVTLLLISSTIANAQVESRDSLYQLLAASAKDTGRVMLLIQIADTYETNNQDSAIWYLEQSKQLSDILNFKMGAYLYNEKSAIVSFTKGDYKLAMQQSNNALDAAIALKDSGLIVNMLNNTGIVYQYLGQFDSQLDYSLQALAITERSKNMEKLAAMHHNVANAYLNLSQFRKSIDHCLLSLNFYQKIKSYEYINRLYASLGQGYASLNLSDSALYYYKIAIKESVKMNDKYAEAAIYGYMANVYADRKEFKEMQRVSEISFALTKELQSNQMLASSLCNIAYASYFNGDNTEAKKHITEALQIATRDSLKDELKNIYSVLSFIAARDGDFNTSLWAKKKNDSIQVTLLNEQVIKTTSELERKYESEKKDKQIFLQQVQIQKRTFLNYSLMGSTVTLLVIFLLFYLSYEHKRKLQRQQIKELEKERQLTTVQAVLKGEEQERSRLAKDLHDGLGGMLSGIKFSFQTMKGNLIMTPQNQQTFERSMDMLDSSIKEMRRVAHNMMPESLVRFGLETALKDYCNDINSSGALQISYQSFGLEDYNFEQTMAITIYRIIQELINNILKHAAAKTAIVQITKSDSLLAITVEDDGKGFDPGIFDQSKGMGWINIRNRVDFLKGKLDVNSQAGHGTSVQIEFNI
jgi:two-component system NarL family sensor kinase